MFVSSKSHVSVTISKVLSKPQLSSLFYFIVLSSPNEWWLYWAKSSTFDLIFAAKLCHVIQLRSLIESVAQSLFFIPSLTLWSLRSCRGLSILASHFNFKIVSISFYSLSYPPWMKWESLLLKYLGRVFQTKGIASANALRYVWKRVRRPEWSQEQGRGQRGNGKQVM